MQQRRIFYDTRTVVEIDALMNSCEAVLLETELAEQWNDTLVDPAVLGEEAWLADALLDESSAFFAMLHADRAVPDSNPKKSRKYSLSDDIANRARRPQVKREVLDLIAEEKKLRVATSKGEQSLEATDTSDVPALDRSQQAK